MKEQIEHKSILIADDEVEILNVWELYFSNQYGYNVVTTQYSTEVQKLIQSYDVQAVLLDISMPEKSGIEILGEIRKVNRNLPVILISAYGSMEAAVSALRYGAYDFLKKPVDLEKLGYLVERAIENYQLAQENQALQKLLESELESAKSLKSFYHSIICSLPSGLITIDTERKITEINQTASNIINLEGAEAKSKDMLKVLNISELEEMIDKALKGEVVNSREFYFHEKESGQRICIGYSCSPLKNSDDEIIGAILVFKDITAMKQMEEQVNRMDRLATLGEFTASLAHEIKNPLAGIHTALEYLLMITEPGSKENKYMNLVKEETERVTKLIQSMLSYSNPKPLEKTKFFIENIMERILDLNQQRIKEKNINILREYEKEKPIWADRDKIEQILLNLFNNALDAISDGGNIYLKTGILDKNLVMEIADDGVGMTKKVQDQIFQPFFTQKLGGFGLGLPIVERIIQEHNGEIEVESEKGGGTTFRIFLPIEKIG